MGKEKREKNVVVGEEHVPVLPVRVIWKMKSLHGKTLNHYFFFVREVWLGCNQIPNIIVDVGIVCFDFIFFDFVLWDLSSLSVG